MSATFSRMQSTVLSLWLRATKAGKLPAGEAVASVQTAGG